MEQPIQLPAELYRRVDEAASARGVTVTQYVCTAVEGTFVRDTARSIYDDDDVFDAGGRDETSDAAANHDDHLYS